MNTFSEIIRHWSLSLDEPVALATEVCTIGLTYRKPGARKLVHADGATAGVAWNEISPSAQAAPFVVERLNW